MKVSAPRVNSVNALNPRAPRAFFRALSEADSLCREVASVERLRDERDELLCRVDELCAEIVELRAELAVWRAKASAYKTAGDA